MLIEFEKMRKRESAIWTGGKPGSSDCVVKVDLLWRVGSVHNPLHPALVVGVRPKDARLLDCPKNKLS